MRQETLQDWLEDSCTREFLKLVQTRHDAYRQSIDDLVMNTKTLVDIDNQLSQYKGQIFALKNILDLEFFMGDLLDEEKEIYTTGPESNPSDGYDRSSI